MALRLIFACDAPACAGHLEGPWSAWGEGRDPAIAAVVRAGWTVDDAGRVYCPEHARARPAAGGSPPMGTSR